MNVMLRSLVALTLLGAFGAVRAGDPSTDHGNQASDAAPASARDAASSQPTGKRQSQKVTAKVGKIEDIDGDGVAAARAVSARGVATGKVSVGRSTATSTAQNNALYRPKDK
jgi:hypothetical protein